MQIPESQLSDQQKEDNNRLVFSYLTLRNLIGIFGLLLPWLLAIRPTRPGPKHDFEPSISDYFYTDRGDLLVVLLSVLAVFLFTYKGYTLGERLLTILAGICALGVAFVPTGYGCDKCALSVHTTYGGIFHNALVHFHLAFAAVFLFCLAVISIKYFRMTVPGTPMRIEGKLTQKGKRNRMYLVCGCTMIGSLVILGVYFTFKKDLEPLVKDWPIVYIFETIAVEAFGISWLTKGETLWPDGEHYLSRLFTNKISKQNAAPDPASPKRDLAARLVPRTPITKQIGWSYQKYMEEKTKRPRIVLAEPDPIVDKFDSELQYLFDTKTDMTLHRAEISALWVSCLEILSKQTDHLNEFNELYIFPLVSLVGEAGFSEEERKDMMTDLEETMKEVLSNLPITTSPVQTISDINHWFLADRLYLSYLKIGVSYRDIGYLKRLNQGNIEAFEAIKPIAPKTFIKFAENTAHMYSSVPADYQAKFYPFVTGLGLQAVLVAKNSGDFNGYEQLLESYYTLKFQKNKLLNQAFRFFTGYGERPWRLLYLLLLLNLIFALVFAALPSGFSGAVNTIPYWEKLLNFIYFNNTTMLTVGYGDIYPNVWATKAAVIILQLTGFAISSAAVALFLRKMWRF